MKFIRLYNERWFLTGRKNLIKSFLTSVVIFLVTCYTVRKGAFENLDSTKAMLFSLLMCSIWSGLFNSIGQYGSESSYVDDELRKMLPVHVYIIATMLIHVVLCILQAICCTAIFELFFDYNNAGVDLFNCDVDLAITYFLVIVSADMLGMALGTIFDNIMNIIPIVLIIQMLESGCLFDLSGILDKVSRFTTARYGFCALGSIIDINSLPTKMEASFPQLLGQIPKSTLFENSTSYITNCWLHLGLLTIAAILIAAIGLYFKVNRRS